MVTIRDIFVRITLDARAFVNGIRSVEYGLIRTHSDLDRFRAGFFKLGATMHRSSRIFAGWAMSVMFFGMAMSRFFSRLLKSGVNTFIKVMESSENFGTAIQQLAVHWEYLKFVLGSVINQFLEPLMPRIVAIINAISEWIQKHPELTSKIVLWGMAIGTALFLIGMLRLAIGGLIGGFDRFLIVLASLKKYLKSVGVWMWKTFVQRILDGAIPALSKLTSFLTTTVIGKGLLGLLAMLLYLGFKWKWNWKAMLANAVVWGLKLIKWLVKIGAGLVGVFDVAFAAIRDGLAALINWIVKKFVDMINWIASRLPARFRKMFGIGRIRAPEIIGIGAVSRAIERFRAVQEGINASFDTKIRQWEDVMGAWREVLYPGAVAPTPVKGAAPETTLPEQPAPIKIDTVNITSDAATIQELMDDLKRYAVVTNTEV